MKTKQLRFLVSSVAAAGLAACAGNTTSSSEVPTPIDTQKAPASTETTRLPKPMDESYEEFLREMGPSFAKRAVSQDYAMKYKGLLPDRLLQYWTEYGWCGYADGLFWTVDPQEYAPVLDAWLESTPFRGKDDYFVIARTAFGDLFVWGKRTGLRLVIHCPQGLIYPRGKGEEVAANKMDLKVGSFFVVMDREYADLEDDSEVPLFTRALSSLGKLNHDEMYGFVPALALGGRRDLKYLKKVKIIEHLAILAQLDTPRIMTNLLAK